MSRRRVEAIRAFLRSHRRVVIAVQLSAVGVFLAFVAVAIVGEFHGASDRLAAASWTDFLLACAAIAAYYLLFVLGWMRILAAWGVTLSYPAALQAEMLSMLAKYVPGGVWTPAARVIAARRAGVTDTGLVTASIFVEAGLSAVAGVLVFVVSLAWVGGVDAPLLPIIAFAAIVVVLLHPRVFQPLAAMIVRRLGGRELPPLPLATLLSLLLFYSFTWLVGGLGLFFLVRAVDGAPSATTIAFLGGVSAIGAIVAVLSVFAPSGLGPREASMYGLMLAVTVPGAALGATALNRLAITIVEVLLLLLGRSIIRALTRKTPAVTEAD